ncbi:MAG: helix-turn-helix domain-containing protein [Methylovirgula sp.]
MTDISIAQLRAARGLLGWSQQKLAEKAHIPFASLLDYECGARQVPLETATRLKYILEQAGVVFAADETGVSLLPPPEVVPLEKLNSSNDE